MFKLKPAPFCTLFAGLGSTNKSATSLLLSSYVTLTLSSPLCHLFRLTFYLELCGRSGRSCFLYLVLSGYNWSPDTRFSRGTTRLISWPDRERYLRSLQSIVVSLLLSLVSTLVFSRTGGVLSHRNSSTRRLPRFPPRNLCSLVTLVVWRLSVPLRPMVLIPECCLASGTPWFFALSPFLGRGRVNNNIQLYRDKGKDFASSTQYFYRNVKIWKQRLKTVLYVLRHWHLSASLEDKKLLKKSI